MNGIPKSRFSGLVVIIILLVILTIGLYTLFSRHSNEQKLIKRGFVTLKRNAGSIKGKLRIYSIKNYNSIKGSIKTDSLELALKMDSLKNPLIKENEELKRNIQKVEKRLSDKEDKLKELKPISYADKGILVNFDPFGKAESFPDSVVNDTLTINSSFFTEILDRDFFDDYVVFNRNKIFYKSLDAEINEESYFSSLKKNFYLPATYRIFTGKKDSSIMLSSWNSGFIAKTIINYRRYFQFVYPIKINNDTWYISGLLSNQHYLDKKQHIETWILIFIGILLIFTLFSFQFLKLFLLSKTERVNTSDIVFISFSISGIACFVSLLILNINSLFGIKYNCDRQLKDLSNTIKDNFVTELNLMYNVIQSYEKATKKNKEKYFLTDYDRNNVDKGLRKAVNDYPYFTYLFCSNQGMADSIISTTQKATSPRISYRQYYLKKDEWLLPGSDMKKRFRFESIYSSLNGETTVGFSKPSYSRTKWVYCMATSMYSVMNTILPPGFEFRIIGKDGNVWFHNNKKKNNRENFLDECDQNYEVLESIHNRVATSMPLRISLKNYRSYISPIGTLPLYLVTLCDTKQQNEFFSHINYILFVFILSGIFLALMSAGLFYYEKLNKSIHHTKYKDYESGLIWLMPDTRKNDKYLILSGLNVLIGAFISISLLFRGITVVHIILIMFSVYSVCFIYFYYVLKSHEKGVFKKSIPIVFAIIFGLSNIIYCTTLKNSYLFLLFETAAIFLVYIILVKSNEIDIISKAPPIFKNDIYIPYSLFVLTWMVISCVLPTILLFRTSGREEIELITKKSQVEIAEKIERKNLEIDSVFIKNYLETPSKRSEAGTGKVKNSVNDSAKLNYIDNIKYSLKQKGNYLLGEFKVNTVSPNINKFDFNGSPRDRYIRSNRFLRQMFRKEDVRSYQLLTNVGLDTAWYWTGGYLSASNPDSLELFYKTKQKKLDGFYAGQQLKISSFLPEQKRFYKSHNLGFTIYRYLTFLAVIIFLFLIIYQVVKHVFILDNNYEIQTIKDSDIPKSDMVYVISSLGQDRIRKHFLKTHTMVSMDNPDTIGSLKNMLICFNPYPEKIIEWAPLFKTLDRSIETTPVNIILISHYTPLQVSNMIEELYQNASTAEMKDLLREFKNRLIKLFSYFEVYFIENDKVIKDLSSQEYHYLWEKCTLGEKFILSDLSLDAVVNTKNKEDIKNLIGKGILDIKGKLSFVNRGFEKYIMELAGTDEFKYLEKNSKRSDGWNKVKAPLYIIFGAVVLFFFFTQQEVISTISAAILSITGLLGTLLKFGSFGGKTENK